MGYINNSLAAGKVRPHFIRENEQRRRLAPTDRLIARGDKLSMVGQPLVGGDIMIGARSAAMKLQVR